MTAKSSHTIKKILVTGAAGFIGYHLSGRLLEEGREVVGLDNMNDYYDPVLKEARLSRLTPHVNFKSVRKDLSDRAAMEELFVEEQIDSVVHFAAESHVDRSITGPAAFIQTNIVGTFSLLEAARKTWLSDSWKGQDPCFLHVSTDEVYGSLGETGMFTETTPFDPRSPYSASKASSDHLVNAYFHTYNLPILITNCSNNYGPYQFPEKLIPLVFHNSMTGKPLPIYGDGKYVRDWLYVKDHCEAIVEVLEKGKAGQSYNIGGNNEKQNLEVVTRICDTLDQKLGLPESGEPRRSLITFVKDRLGHDRRYAIDASFIKEELGWEPKVTFEQGIAWTVDWYLANQEWVESIIDGSYRE